MKINSFYCLKKPQSLFKGLPYSSVGKESACNAGDPGSFPGSGRSPGEENGNSSILAGESHVQLTYF